MIRWLRHISCLIFLLAVLPLSSQVNGDSDQVRRKHIKTIFLGSSADSLQGLTLFYDQNGVLYMERYVTFGNGYEPGDVTLWYYDHQGRPVRYVHAYLPDSSQANTTGPFEYVLQNNTYSYPSDTVVIMHDTTWNIFRQLTFISSARVILHRTNTITPRGRRPVCLPESIEAYRSVRNSSMTFIYADKYSLTPIDSVTHEEVSVTETRIVKNKIVRNISQRRYFPDRTEAISTVDVFTLNTHRDTVVSSRINVNLEPFDSISPIATRPDFPYPCYAEGCYTQISTLHTRKFLGWYTVHFYWLDKNEIQHRRIVTRYPENLAVALNNVYLRDKHYRKERHTLREYKAVYAYTCILYSYWQL